MLRALLPITVLLQLPLVTACSEGSGATAPSTSAAGASGGIAAPGGAGANTPSAGAPAAGSGGRTSLPPSAAGAGASSAAGSDPTATPAAGSGGTGSPAVGGGAGAAGPSGAAGGSAGTSSNAGAGGTTAPAANGCKDALLCESFEDGATLDPARWETVAPNCMGDAEAALDPQVARGGKQSARVRAAGGYCNHLFISPKLSAPLPERLFGRLYVRFDRPLTAAHVTFLAMLDATDNKDLRMGGQSEILMWNRESDDATLPELSPTGIAMSLKPAAQTWLCVEFEIDASTRSLRTWVDGQPVAGLQVEGDGTPDVDAQWRRKADWQPKLQNLKLGWESYGDQANTVWFDDVALGAARLGCTP